MIDRIGLVCGTVFFPTFYLLHFSVDEFFDSYNWLFFGVTPATCLFLAFSFIEIEPQNISKTFRPGFVVLRYSVVQWSDVMELNISRSKKDVKLKLNTILGQGVSFTVPRDTEAVAIFEEARRQYDEIRTS